jgi:hypothetical protein
MTGICISGERKGPRSIKKAGFTGAPVPAIQDVPVEESGIMKEYRLIDIKTWCIELSAAAEAFEREFMQKPRAVGYSENVYNKINLIVNQEKENVKDADGNRPEEDEFIELGSVGFTDTDLYIWICDDFPDDRFALFSGHPDGDDGEPYYVPEESDILTAWRRTA